MKTLIVDDDPRKVDEVTRLIAGVADGGEIQVATSGLAAREFLSGTQYDLLILDIRLPMRPGEEPDRRGGISLLSEITLSRRFRKPTHVVALTGYEELRREFETKFNNGQWSIEIYDQSDIGWRERLVAKAAYINQMLRETGKDYLTDLCVVTALSSPELDAIRRLPWRWSDAIALDQVTFAYKGAYSCEGQEFSVVAAAAPRMGMVATSTLAQKTIRQIRPRMLVMTGICAGLSGEAEIGDIILADPCWDWQMGKYLKEAFEVAPDQVPAPMEITQRMNILRGERDFFVSLAKEFPGEKANSIPRLLTGPMASGSSVLADTTAAEFVKEQHRKLVGLDMELYGLYSASRDCDSPRPLTFGLKAVCDLADHLKNDKFQKYAAYLSAETLRRFVERFSTELIPS